jgi:hypothetical protein
MAEEASLEASAAAIETALEALAPAGEPCHVHLFESSMGNLRAIVATDAFKGVGVAERQNRVWDHLRQTAAAEHLRALFGVHVYDLEEFARMFPGDPSGALSTFIAGIRNEAG